MHYKTIVLLCLGTLLLAAPQAIAEEATAANEKAEASAPVPREMAGERDWLAILDAMGLAEDPSRSATARRYTQSGLLGMGQLLADKMALYRQTGLYVVGRHTQTYQMNLHSESGIFTGRHSGRWQGRYDVDMHWDMEPLLKLKGASVHMTATGHWSNGLNASSVGAFMNVSSYGTYRGNGDEAIYVSQYFYDQQLLDEKVLVRLGKFALGNFDRNYFAEDPSRQFMNAALSSNPSIPFPEAGLGVMVDVRPLPEFYVTAAVVDANADSRETGFNTAFHGRDDSFTIVETGWEPLMPFGETILPGAYRIGFWYDPQPKGRYHDGFYISGSKRDDCGLYLNASQMIWKECPDNPFDMQGVGVFARYGYRPGNITWNHGFWSAGLQYQGLIPGRPADTMGFGVAQAMLESSAAIDKSQETAYEIYYDAQIMPFFNMGGSLQVIENPGGVNNVDHATVIGLRASLTF
ncbi:MAG: carbohydrate porin [Phycisphaerae bacterium]|nr:carbohydrate porin [Phycisphaerae bacterium]